MKTRRPGGAVRDAVDKAVLGRVTPAFRILSCFPVAYGSKDAEVAIEINGVRAFSFDVFRPADRDAFIAPRSIRSKYSGNYEQTFKLYDALAAEILRAVEERENDGSVAS